MPRFKIDTGLYDPLVIEIGDKVYTAIPRSIQFTEATRLIAADQASGKIDEIEASAQFLGLLFDVDAQEFKVLDRTILEAIAEKARAYVSPQPQQRVSPATDEQKVNDAISEATAGKNASKPGFGITP